MIIQDRENRPVVVIERKTWSDFQHSLNRGDHLEEQLSRMLPYCETHGARPVLLIECERVHGWVDNMSKRMDCFMLSKAVQGLTVLGRRTCGTLRRS